MVKEGYIFLVRKVKELTSTTLLPGRRAHPLSTRGPCSCRHLELIWDHWARPEFTRTLCTCACIPPFCWGKQAHAGEATDRGCCTGVHCLKYRPSDAQFSALSITLGWFPRAYCLGLRLAKVQRGSLGGVGRALHLGLPWDTPKGHSTSLVEAGQQWEKDQQGQSECRKERGLDWVRSGLRNLSIID